MMKQRYSHEEKRRLDLQRAKLERVRQEPTDRGQKGLSAFLSALVLLFAVVFFYVVSWSITCLAVWAIFACFHLDFSWSAGTGIWLILWLLKSLSNNRH